MTCVDLLEIATIRKVAVAEYGKDMRVTTDKVSDALGLMWRRGYLKRFPAPQTSKTLARFAYLWDDKVSRPAAPVSFPERVYFHHWAYYYARHSGKRENLGRDYAKAMAAWALHQTTEHIDCAASKEERWH